MAQNPAYIRGQSLDSALTSRSASTERDNTLGQSIGIRAIPVFHERSRIPDQNATPCGSIQTDEARLRGRHHSVDIDDILFNKQSGVTRIPAARVRRHSVQFGESGSFRSPFAARSRTPTANPYSYPESAFPHPVRDGVRSPGDDRSALYPCLDTAGEKPAPPVGHSYSEPPRRPRGCLPDPGSHDLDLDSGSNWVDNRSDRNPDGTSGKVLTSIGGVSERRQRHRRSIPIDLTPVQSDASSHIVCYKGSGLGKGDLADLAADRPPGDRAGRDMGVSAVDQSRHLSESVDVRRGEPGARHVTARPLARQSSSSFIALTSDGPSTDVGAERRIHVRRHSLCTPSALRHAPRPTLRHDFQDWAGKPLAPPAGRPDGDDAGTPTRSGRRDPDDAVRNGWGSLVPARRYSVTYVPQTAAEADPDGGGRRREPESVDKQVEPPSEGSKNQKRFTRRRCRPLSIVKETVSPASGEWDDFDSGVLTDDSAKSGDVTLSGDPDVGGTTAVNIERDGGNVNIIAGGKVNISLKTDKPLAVVGRSTPDQCSEFALWTPGADPGRWRGGVAADGGRSQLDQNPLGVWRRGNVIVDSVRTAIQDGGYPGSGPSRYQVPYAAVQPIPMIYHPYLNPELRAGYPFPADGYRSAYSPLSVDTGLETPSSLPFPVPQPVFRHQQGARRLLGTKPNVATKQNAIQKAPPATIQHKEEVGWGGEPVRSTARQDASGDRQPMGNGVGGDVTGRSDDASPPPDVDVKEIIADFENKSDRQAVVPEFGTAFGSVSSSRRSSRGTESEAERRYSLEVDEADRKWIDAQSPSEPEAPSTLRAYIAEMSITERRYDDEQAGTLPD